MVFKNFFTQSGHYLLDYSQEDLLEIGNFGQQSAEEVIDALKKRLGINLPKERNDWSKGIDYG
jgi:DNA-directed RNA polymerase alpha subunit